AWSELADLADLRSAAGQHGDVLQDRSARPERLFCEGTGGRWTSVSGRAVGAVRVVRRVRTVLYRGPHIPVFSLLPSHTIDVSAAENGYPQRAAVFHRRVSVGAAVANVRVS